MTRPAPIRLTPDEISQVLTYDPKSGLFFWKRRLSSRRSVGSEAGTTNGLGYRWITIRGRTYAAHRLAWVLMTGTDPLGDIDHKDGNPTNNAWGNLRECSHAENHQNRGLNAGNSSGFPGVSWDSARKMWKSCIKVNYRFIFLGRFLTPEAAHEAYLNGKEKYHLFNPSLRAPHLSDKNDIC